MDGRTNNNETQAGSECSLTEAIQDVTQQAHAQTVALREKQQTLVCLQATLSGQEEKGEKVELKLKSKVRQALFLQAEMEDLQQHMTSLAASSLAAYHETIKLRVQVEDEEERSRANLTLHNTYRNKMEGHRGVVSQTESLTEAHQQLEEQRAVVKTLAEKREELRADLRNPEGTAVKQAQKEVDELREQLAALRKTLPEKRELLQKEFDNHRLIKKDIEIQNRRYEAIVKRLHCQLKKAQSSHRQLSADIYDMERQIEDLKGQLDPPNKKLKGHEHQY